MIEFRQIAEVFDHHTEAVLAARDGIIVYGNNAARILMPAGFENMPVETFLPGALIEDGAERRAGTAVISGRQVNIVVSSLDVYRVFTITAQEAALQGIDADAIVESAVQEMRSMLMTIRAASVQLMSHTEFVRNEKMLRYMAMMNHSCYSITRLTNHFVEFSSDPQVRRRMIDLDQVYGKMIADVTELTADREIDIVYTCKEGCSVYADAYLMQRMLLELLSNSLKYTPSGGKISVSVIPQGEKVRITVKDTGCGIRPEMLMTVWNRFQEQKPLNDPRAGVGFGLTFVQRIARLHGGNVLLESSLGKGTTVTVFIEKGEPELVLRSPIPDRTIDLRTELADILSSEQYTHRFMD